MVSVCRSTAAWPASATPRVGVTGSPHTVTVVYTNTDGNYAGSTGDLTGGQTVSQALTSTTVTADANPSVFSQSVTFTATVTVDSSGGQPVTDPMGTVIFSVGGDPIGEGTLTVVDGQDQATFATRTLTTGSHVIWANYTGDGANFGASPNSAPIIQVVNPAMTTTTVTSDANPSVYGQMVTFTATATATAPGGGLPTGSVQFLINATNFGGPAALIDGTASVVDAALSVSGLPYNVTAFYTNFDGNYAGSAGALTGGQMVNKATPSYSNLLSPAMTYGDKRATPSSAPSATSGPRPPCSPPAA